MAAGALTQKNYLHYAVGLDYGIGSLKLSAQFIQKYIMDYNDFIYGEEFGNTMTFLASYDDNSMIYTKIKYNFQV